MQTNIPIKIQIVKSLSTAQPSRIVAVKADGDTTFTLWVTDKTGVPYPLKDNTGGGGGTIEAIQNTDGNLTITGTTTKTINVSSSLLLLINSTLQAGDNVSSLTNDANYITLADIPAFVASDYDLEDFTNAGVDPFAHLSDLSGGVTNLSYTASPTQGIVTSDTGTNATIPLADGTNAGLLKPAKYTVLENTSGTNTGDQDLSGKQDTLVSGTNIKTKGGISLLGSGDIPNSAKITTTVSITNATLTVAGDVQEGKIVKIDNGVNVINYTVNGTINASFIKMGTGAITFVQGSGRTLTGANGTLILNGAVNSTASIVSDGTVDTLYINNL